MFVCVCSYLRLFWDLNLLLRKSLCSLTTAYHEKLRPRSKVRQNKSTGLERGISSEGRQKALQTKSEIRSHSEMKLHKH